MPSEEIHIWSNRRQQTVPHGDSSWVAAEVDNLLKDPFHIETLVKHAEIGDVVQPPSIGIGKDVYTVVDRHNDVFLCII